MSVELDSVTNPFKFYKRIEDPEEARQAMTHDLIALSSHIHMLNASKGWWHDPHTGKRKQRAVGDLLILVHSEISEGYEAWRKSLPDDHLPQFPGLDAELGDAMIRLFDMIGGLSLSTCEAIPAKLEYNFSRVDHTMAHRALPGGKKL